MVYHRSSKSGAEGGSSSNSRTQSAQNVFRNDGSFLEMFKRMQEASSSASTSSSTSGSAEPTSSVKSSVSASATDSKPVPDNEGKNSGAATASVSKLPMVGKRRGGRVLPTGQVKKVKQEKPEVGEDKPKDAWSQYLAEVKKYRETTCEEEGKTRPLVK